MTRIRIAVLASRTLRANCSSWVRSSGSMANVVGIVVFVLAVAWGILARSRGDREGIYDWYTFPFYKPVRWFAGTDARYVPQVHLASVRCPPPALLGESEYSPLPPISNRPMKGPLILCGGPSS